LSLNNKKIFPWQERCNLFWQIKNRPSSFPLGLEVAPSRSSQTPRVAERVIGPNPSPLLLINYFIQLYFYIITVYLFWQI